MQIDMQQVLRDFTGEPFKDIRKDPPVDFILKNACVDALFVPEKDLSSEERMKRWNLAQKIYAADGALDLEAAEVTMIQKLAAKNFLTAFYGVLHTALEGKNG